MLSFTFTYTHTAKAQVIIFYILHKTTVKENIIIMKIKRDEKENNDGLIK